MRLAVCCLLIAGATFPAFAADFENTLLRGSSRPVADPPVYARWSGLYAGGQVGEDFRGVDFRSVGGNSIATITAMDANFNGVPLSNFPQLSKLTSPGPSFGGFVGYNYQIEDVVMGFELNFNKSSLNASVNDMQSHGYYVTNSLGNFATTFNVNTAAKASIADYGTVRGRLGWAYGNFLPYLFLGTSVAQIDTYRSVNVNYYGIQKNPPTPPPLTIGGDYTEADSSHGKWVLGWDIGLGIDYMLTRNVFLRGEFEYIQFGSPSDIKLNSTSVRTGLGLRF